MLYLGPRDREHLAVARRSWQFVITLDRDVTVCPDILADLDAPFPRLVSRDGCVAAYVFMYLEDPLKALRELLRKHQWVLVQENVIRRRGDDDPDRNRFTCVQLPEDIREEALMVSIQDKKNLVDLTPYTRSVMWYKNGPGVSAVWDLRSSAGT